MKYDIIVIGSGPGGYVTAIRASQLGFKTAIIEKESLGGVCLNWGCIPTKALLKSAQVYDYLKHIDKYGLKATAINKDFSAVVTRSRRVAADMSKGVDFLIKKNKIDVIKGSGKIQPNKKVRVIDTEGKENIYDAKHIIIATGARSRELPNLPQDDKKIIGYRRAMNLAKQPKKLIVVGSGAIGVEFAYFYQAMGTEVTIVEFQPNLVPVEDIDISKQFERSFKKQGIKVMTNAMVESVDTSGSGVVATIKTKNGKKQLTADIVLSAVGIKSNIENIGLEEVGIIVDKDKILVDAYYQTNLPGYYAIGDVVPGQALAHVASAEGITCVEKIAGLEVSPINYDNIPGCTYSSPEIASVGFTESKAKEAGYDIKVGKFPFSASGKAKAAGTTDGFVKVIFDAKYGEWLGCHMIGSGVTDMIAEAVLGRKLETTGHEVLKAVHPHPTMSEAIMEAVADAYGEFMSEKFNLDEQGYYGRFGGAFIPELLYPNVKELEVNYLKIIKSQAFQKTYDELLSQYVGRPTPLYFAQNLSQKYGAKIYLKREDLCHTGAHKVNNTIGQILIAKELGKKYIIAETGAGQHGVATATVCALMNLKCKVFMGATDIERQAPNVARMKMLGAEVVSATSGSKTLKDATNEAIRYWIQNPESYYLIGSVVGPHPYPDMVARLQAVISEEIKKQLKTQEGRANPDTVIACVGGGSNAAGAFYHFLEDTSVDLIAVEAAGLGVETGESAATSQLGETGIIHGSKTLLMQDDYGQIVEPYSISAGLDYPGVGPLHAHLFETGRATFMNATDKEALEAAYDLSKTEGIIPALETAHALAVLEKMKLHPEQIIVINLSGRGDKDLQTYIKHFQH
uniref:Dihydrolipoyl dehydrogenase n=1 Tax=Stylophora pistillata TaxID=50429 RepID=A0A2B4RK45_STYPI